MMDRELLMKTMKVSISEVLEKMFFLPLELSDPRTWNDLWEDPAAAELLGISLEFNGPFSGRLLFLIPWSLGTGLTADFMGVQTESVSPEHVEETAKEIINMMAGSTFGTLDNSEVFQLGIPETLPVQTVLDRPTAQEKAVFVGIKTLEGFMGLLLVAA